MTQVIDQAPRESPADIDLTAAVHQVLAASPEPLTLSKIRSALPSRFRRVGLEELAETLRRQVAANVLQQYPKYRSAQDRFWDRSMPVHVAKLLCDLLEQFPLAWSQLRRKLPAYALPHTEAVLQEQVAQGLLFRHPAISSRAGERFGVAPPDPKDYLRLELPPLFRRLEQMGFTEQQLRESAMSLLQEAEWGLPPGTEQPARRRAKPTDAGPVTVPPPGPEVPPQAGSPLPFDNPP
jgi:hypothetical protein